MTNPITHLSLFIADLLKEKKFKKPKILVFGVKIALYGLKIAFLP